MDISVAFLMFLSGIFTYAFSLRIFNVYTKSLFYKMTFINCLTVLRFADSIAQDLINNCEGADKESTDKAFGHWRVLALYSLKTCMPDGAWQQMSVADWDLAMKLLGELEKQRIEND